jgi:hypothetical protein
MNEQARAKTGTKAMTVISTLGITTITSPAGLEVRD